MPPSPERQSGHRANRALRIHSLTQGSWYMWPQLRTTRSAGASERQMAQVFSSPEMWSMCGSRVTISIRRRKERLSRRLRLWGPRASSTSTPLRQLETTVATMRRRTDRPPRTTQGINTAIPDKAPSEMNPSTSKIPQTHATRDARGTSS